MALGVWMLILLMREIVAYVCAPAITADQIAYLNVLIEEYIQSRVELFPHHPLYQSTITSVTILCLFFSLDLSFVFGS